MVYLYYVIIFFNYFCCPRRCATPSRRVFTALHHSFMVFCHENKVWYRVLLDIQYLPRRRYKKQPHLYQHAVVPSPTSQWVGYFLVSLHYLLIYTKPEFYFPVWESNPNPLDCLPSVINNPCKYWNCTVKLRHKGIEENSF